MGLDVRDVRVVVNVGMPTSDWILQQQSGREGRDGQQAVTVTVKKETIQ
jgi:superfamily II DNA helicase RecQ